MKLWLPLCVKCDKFTLFFSFLCVIMKTLFNMSLLKLQSQKQGALKQKRKGRITQGVLLLRFT